MRQCLGFDNESGGLLFLSENSYASNRSAKRPRGGGRRSPVRRGGHAQTASKPSSPRGGASAEALPPTGLSIISSPFPDIEEVAISSFTQSFLAGANQLPHDIWCLLGKPGFAWGLTHTPTAYNLAATAVSMAVFSRKHNCQIALAKSRAKYSAALIKTQSMIASECACVDGPSDQLLLAVMLLAAYEDRVCNFNRHTMFTEGFRHQDGALALLKMRKRDATTAESSLLLDRQIRRQLLRTSMFRAADLPSWLLNGTSFGEEGAERDLDRLVVSTVQLRHRMFMLFECFRSIPESERPTLHESFDLGIKDCKEIDNELQKWSDTLAPEFDYASINHSTTYSTESLFYPTIAHNYTSIHHATLHNRYRGTRIVANGLMTTSLRFKLLSTPSPSPSPPSETTTRALSQGSPEATLQTTRATMRRMADEIAASIPFHFGLLSPTGTPKKTSDPIAEAMGAAVYPLVWPVTIAAASAEIAEEQRAWLQRKLAFIGMVVGSGVLEGLSKVSSAFLMLVLETGLGLIAKQADLRNHQNLARFSCIQNR
jgi:hypothetical protein